MQHLEVTDTDGSEEITGITINALQVGWVIRDGGGNIIFTGDGTTDYTVSAVDVASAAYKRLHQLLLRRTLVETRTSLSLSKRQTLKPSTARPKHLWS
ncbi:MAG: hypothetical protein ACOXZX_00855 [Synergistaceae bacterium]